MARDWPLTGRADELRFIGTAMRRADGPSGIVLAGPAGVGKTRLAHEALRLADRRGTITKWAYGSESARAIPLGAFAGLLGDIGDDPARLLPRAIGTLTAVPGAPRMVLGVDDAHLLDELSATLVHQLVVRRSATVLLTVRAGERAPDAVTALWKDEHLLRHDLRPLSAEETASLLEAVLDGPIASRDAARMSHLTSGNALFLRHLVDGELDAGRLAKVGGLWCWAEQPAISPELAELVGTRMGGIPEPVRDVVDLLALGEPLGTSLLSELAGAAAVESAESRGLIRADVDGRRLQVRLAHPLYGEVRRREMGILRARRLRGVIATAIAGTGARRSEDTLRRAVLTLDSDLEPDPALFVRAAHTAVRLFDLHLGQRLAGAAVDAGGGSPAKLTLAYALSWGSRCAEAEKVLAALSAEATNDYERAQIGGARAGNLFWPLGRSAEAEEVLDSTLSSVTDTKMRTLLLAMRAAFDVSLGRMRLALESGREILALPSLTDQAVVMGAIAVVGAAGALGMTTEMRLVADRAYEAAARSYDAGIIRFGVSDLHILGARLSGELDSAMRVAQQRRAESEDTPGPPRLMGLVLLGQATQATGRLRTAIRLLQEARAGLVSLETHEFLCRCLSHLTQALAMAGEAEEAGVMLDQLREQWRGAYTVDEPDLLLGKAWVAAAQGSVTEAVAAAREAAELARRREQPAYEVLALQTAVGFGDRTVAARLRELSDVVEGPRASIAAAHAEALAAREPDDLLSVAARWERMGDLLAAADTAAQAAITYAGRDQRGSSATAAAKAHRLAQACEGARTPALRAAARPLPLSDREREIVTLAAQGLSNREIAERLVVSVRTVEGHIYRVGTRLGVNDRRQFAALLGDD